MVIICVFRCWTLGRVCRLWCGMVIFCLMNSFMRFTIWGFGMGMFCVVWSLIIMG